jgi:phosphoglycerate dehydrogenase-like enzyme
MGKRHPKNIRILVIHDDNVLYKDDLVARYPELDIRFAVDVESLQAARRAFKPNVIFCWIGPEIPGSDQREALLDPDVDWVHVGGAGFDHLLPLDGAEIVLTTCSGVLSPVMAETVVAAMMMMNYGFPGYIHLQHERRWKQLPWTPLAGKTALIVGMGTIGQAVARLAQAVGMHVIGIRSYPTGQEPADEVLTPDKLHQVLPRADFVCLHLPLTPATRHTISSDEFALMKDSAYLINTARGGVVDEAALLQALQEGEIAGAFSDVFQQEPLPPDSALWDQKNLVISAHASDSIVAWENYFARAFMDNLDRWLAGEALQQVADHERGY